MLALTLYVLKAETSLCVTLLLSEVAHSFIALFVTVAISISISSLIVDFSTGSLR